jgi:hypothetical protein
VLRPVILPEAYEKRRHDRITIREKVRVEWQDERGGRVEAIGRLEDISVSGARLLLPKKPKWGSLRLRADGAKLVGEAVVRYCAPFKIDFAVGLEFVGGLAYCRRLG